MFEKLSSSVLAGSVLAGRVSLGMSLATAFLASSAQAHIRLEEPLARHPITNFDTGIKSCPCGAGGSNRTCDVARDGSDPARSTERVSRFEAGSTITLRFNEYVDHVGRYRVAFDPEGADMADFNANILEDIPDPAGPGNEPWEIEVRLPNMTCNNCTLQLVQAMNNDPVNEVLDPATTSSYYTCVDLELVAPGTLGEDDGMDPAPTPTDPAGMVDDMTDVEDGAMDDGNSMNAGTPGDRPLPGTPGMDPAGTNSTPAPATGTEMGAAEMVAMNGAPGSATPAFNANGVGSGSSNSSAGGCSVVAPGPRAAGSFALLGLVAATVLRWRRPRRERMLSAQAL
jgi:hypothetical protein